MLLRSDDVTALSADTLLPQAAELVKFSKEEFGIIKQLLLVSEDTLTIYSQLPGNIAIQYRPWAVLPASGEENVISSHKGSNCIILISNIISAETEFA